MPLSDEKVDQLLITVLTESMKNMQTFQAENNKLHSDLLKMMQRQMEFHESSLAAKNEMKSEMDLNSDMPQIKRSNKAKPTRPVIEPEIDDVEWGIFLDKWKIYKTIAEVEDETEICLELRESCSPAVYKLLYQFVGTEELNKPDITEVDMLAHIKQVAVKSIHEEVHRWNYAQMTQQSGEPIAKYVGRLKGQAGLCNFQAKCHCGLYASYADEMIGQRLVSGLANAEHQSRIISEAEMNKDLKSKVDRLISLETTDEATNKLRVSNPSRFGALRSQYKKFQKKPDTQRPDEERKRGRTMRRSPPSQRRRCRGCGRTSHANGKPLTREECPANGKTCDECGLMNHFSKVCVRRRTRANFVIMDDDTSSCGESETDCPYTDDEEFMSNDECVESATHSAVRTEDFRRGYKPPYRD